MWLPSFSFGFPARDLIGREVPPSLCFSARVTCESVCIAVFGEEYRASERRICFWDVFDLVRFNICSANLCFFRDFLVGKYSTWTHPVPCGFAFLVFKGKTVNAYHLLHSF